MNYVEVKNYDISNGTGVRVSLFVSGCTHHCKNCFNKEAWDFNYGKEFTNEVIDQIISSLNHSYIEGLTILGGEPMELVNQEGILPLIKRVKKELPSKNIWIYTGYSFDDDLIPWSKKYNFTKEILNNVDVIVDGEFIEDKKDVTKYFRGSSNQRIIDVKETLKTNEIVLHYKNN